MNIKPLIKLTHLPLIIATACLSSNVAAVDQQSLEKRITALEQQLAAKEKSWYENVSFGGLIEVEASYTDPDSASSESDLVVATVELSAEAQLSEKLSAGIVFLYEEDETDLEVDVATINYQFTEGFFLSAGQDYVPFGAYSTALVNDTLALELGETRETTLTAYYDKDGFYGAVYIFNGDNDERGQQKINDYGVRISASNDFFSIGGDYISNLGDSDGLTDAITYNAGDDAIAGAAVFMEFKLGSVTVFTEHLSALDGYAPENNAEPAASQFELALESGSSTYAISLQKTDEAAFLDLPEDRASIGFSTEIADGLSLGVEFVRDDNYDSSKTNSAVVQIAAEF